MSQSICNGSEPAVLLLLISELGEGDLAQRLESGTCRGFARPGHLGGPLWPERAGLCRRGLEGWMANDAGWWAQTFGTKQTGHKHFVNQTQVLGHLGKVIFREGIVFTQLDVPRAGSAAQGAPSWDLKRPTVPTERRGAGKGQKPSGA